MELHIKCKTCGAQLELDDAIIAAHAQTCVHTVRKGKPRSNTHDGIAYSHSPEYTQKKEYIENIQLASHLGICKRTTKPNTAKTLEAKVSGADFRRLRIGSAPVFAFFVLVRDITLSFRRHEQSSGFFKKMMMPTLALQNLRV